MTNPLVSIIIPVYNRAHLIGETLDSVCSQTYKNWECIVVDDGSTDTTVAVIQGYCNKDTRFKLYHRPENKLKGGNAARNYGLEKSQGDYINWFDSDDVMKPTFLQDKVAVLLDDKDVDFVISKSINFFADGTTEAIGYYTFNDKFSLTADHFIQEKVHWITDDLFVKRAKVATVRFDEALCSGQEFNFCVKLLSGSLLKGIYLDELLSYRRIHDHSIQELQKQNEHLAYTNKYIVALKTFGYVYKNISNASKFFFVNRILKLTRPLLLGKTYPPAYLNFLYLYLKTCGFFKCMLLVCYSFLLVLGKDSYSLRKKIQAY